MEQLDYLAGRVRELSRKAYQNDYVTHTDFLSASELASFYEILRKEGISSKLRVFNGAAYTIYGGWEDADRNVICFLPSYLDEEQFLLQERAAGDVLGCIRVTAVQAKFADALNHRDYLGALMNLGIERDKIGDILVDETGAYVFVIREIADFLCQELLRIRHTSVRCSLVEAACCDIRPRMEEVSGSVASERLDAVLAMVFHLPRGKAQELIDRECVFVDGKTITSAGSDLKISARVSVRGYGKFIYDGIENTTKKGRLFVRVRKYV